MAIDLHAESVQRAGPVAAYCVEPGTSVHAVLSELKTRGCGEALVCRDGILVGIFTERDAMRLLASGQDVACSVDSKMTPNPVTLRATDTIGTAVARMSANGYRRLPIVDDEGHPTGLVNVAGIVHWLVQHFPEAVYNLPPVSKPVIREREGP
jgi:CBS domain-containing protein